MPGQVLNHPTEGQFDYSYEVNDIKSATKQVKDFLGDSYGAYRCTQLIAVTGKEVAELTRLAGSSAAPAIKAKANIASKLAGAFIVPYWGYMTLTLNEDIDAIRKEGPSCGNVEQFIKDCCTWIVAGCFSMLHFVPEATGLKKIAAYADLADDGIDLKKQSETFWRAGKLQEIDTLTDEVRTDLIEKRKQAFLGIIKSVVAVTAGIFGILGMILGAPLVPSIVLLTLGFVNVILAIGKHFYAENMERNIKITRHIEQTA